MANIFEVADPRGCKVICTEDRWNNHILAKRNWMKGWELEIVKTISDPLFICQDPDFDDRIIYYRQPKSRYLYIKAVVKLVDGQDGIIISAFPCSSLKSGEKIIWPNLGG